MASTDMSIWYSSENVGGERVETSLYALPSAEELGRTWRSRGYNATEEGRSLVTGLLVAFERTESRRMTAQGLAFTWETLVHRVYGQENGFGPDTRVRMSTMLPTMLVGMVHPQLLAELTAIYTPQAPAEATE